MEDDTTRKLRADEGITDRMTRVETRVGDLEEKVERRLMETRPIWELVLARLDSMEEILRSVVQRLGSLEQKVEGLDQEVKGLDARVGSLESKVEALDHKVESLDHKVEALDHKMDTGFRRIETKIRVLTDTILEVKTDERLLEQRIELLEPKA